MALVTSAKDITVIILDNNEAKALEDILNKHLTLNEDYPVLDKLTDAMLSEKMAFAYEDDETED
jgi:hypothetical protein